ncbi:uncharacterized protein LOC143557614 [Bidens hawaiensis]|uniref:uncharacterized protein LOC143557614 n=1 Tax=Bidens hawaiensis TaxID=980011 RepID=UPI004049F404
MEATRYGRHIFQYEAVDESSDDEEAILHGYPEFSEVRDPVSAMSWISYMEESFRLFRCADEDRVMRAVCKLRSETRVWWDMVKVTCGLRLGAPAKMTWSLFKELFKEEFYPVHVELELVEKYKSLKQERNESLREYTDRYHINYCILITCNYDYSGYGQSTGKPSEHNTYADVDAVYKCLKEKYNVKDDRLILYGQSVGSGPTIDLASRIPDLRGVVLHSPILSGLRVLHPVKRTYWFDIYKNIVKISLVNCPVLVIHGTSDEVVDHSHGKQLWELCKNKYEPLWLTGGGHCNLEFYPEFIRHLKKFVLALGKSKRATNGSTGLTTDAENQKKVSETGSADMVELPADLPEVSRNSLDSRLEKSKKSNKPEKSQMSVDIFRRRKGLVW